MSRSKEINRLRKQARELTESRDAWRGKYFALKGELSRGGDFFGGAKAAGHQYSLPVVALCMALHRYGRMSLRDCRHSLQCMALSMCLSQRIPSHSTIRNWLCKGGMHRIAKVRREQGEYVAFIDESIVFGSEKILLVLGIRADRIDTSRALSHGDVSVLYVGAGHEWKSERIEEEMRGIEACKSIRYVVSDEGNNLRKAYKSLGYTHIEDCMHIIANCLKRLYEKDETFESFRKLVGKKRKDWSLSRSKSRHMPPCMRGRMRFANLFPCVDWAVGCLSEWDALDAEVRQELAFLQEHRDFIGTLSGIGEAFKAVCQILKEKGFGEEQHRQALKVLESCGADGKPGIFARDCRGYLEALEAKRASLGLGHLICSSDIIESYFGKFKSKITANSRSGLTEFLFTMANYSGDFSVEETKQALESVRCKDLKRHKNKPRAA